MSRSGKHRKAVVSASRNLQSGRCIGYARMICPLHEVVVPISSCTCTDAIHCYHTRLVDENRLACTKVYLTCKCNREFICSCSDGTAIGRSAFYSTTFLFPFICCCASETSFPGIPGWCWGGKTKGTKRIALK